MVARITRGKQRFNIARQSADDVLASPVTPSLGIIRRAQVAVALLAMQTGDIPLVEAQYSTLQSTRIGTVYYIHMATDRLLGICATAIGKLDAAVSHFEDALAFCRRAGYLPELAWSLYDYADTLIQRNGDGDPAKAAMLLDESLKTSTHLGMHPLTERVLSLQRS